MHRSSRLRVNQLERRIAPATFVVDNTTDAGTGSLREAMQKANASVGADTIDMSSISGTISLLSRLPTVTDPVAIQGPGAGSLTLARTMSAGSNFRVLTLVSNVSLTGMTISNGVDGSGGGIYTAGRLTITDCAVTSNSATSNGGGIFVESGGLLNITNTVVSLNTAAGGTSTTFAFGGGGIFLQGAGNNPPKMVMKNSVVTGNIALGGTGGGVHVRSDGIVSIDSSTIADNQAAISKYGVGCGGLYFAFRGQLVMTNTTISGNTSQGAAGGVYFYSAAADKARSSWTIRSCTIADNSAKGAGGGIMLLGGGNPITIEATTITGNSATKGGGLYSSVSTNVITIKSTIISGNTAATGPDISSTGVIEAQHSAIGNTTGFSFSGTSMNNLGPMPHADLKLGSLQLNGGSTETIVPAADSPLVDKGSNLLIRGVDQGGRSRTVDDLLVTNVIDGTDIGSVEASTEPLAGNIPVVAAFITSGAASYTLQVVYTDDAAVKLSSIDAADLTISGPSSIMITGVTVDKGSDSPTLVATYALSPADNSWDPADIGNYLVTSVAGEVTDALLNPISKSVIGQFNAVAAAKIITVLNTNDSGPDSLRAALIASNASPGAHDTIAFAIGMGQKTIGPLSALPAITDPVTIDGWTQPGYDTITFTPLIRLAGGSAGVGSNGLRVQSGNTIIRGLSVANFNLAGIVLEGGDNNTIQNCFLGTSATGNTAAPNNFRGIYAHWSDNNLIGGPTVQSRNLISGNVNEGITVLSGYDNTIQNNHIGLKVGGGADLGNTTNGIGFYRGSGYNTIVGNVIGGNDSHGVFLADAGAERNRIQGNRIGTDLTGVSAIGNTLDGILLQNGPANNYIGTDGDGVNDANEGNLISGNSVTAGKVAVEIVGFGSNNNRVAGNIIGLDVTGTTKIATMGGGVTVHNFASGNIVGTNGDGVSDNLEGNIISGTASHGITIAGSGTVNNVVAGNFIGTSNDGKTAIGNAGNGVFLFLGTQSNRIGTNSDGTSDILERNLICASTLNGVTMANVGTQFNLVAGNFIGVDVNGTAALANKSAGVQIFDQASDNVFGGSATSARNIISGNSGAGLHISGLNTKNNVFLGNYIGTDTSGVGALPNGAHGIVLAASVTNTTIGGLAANLIAFNFGDGVSAVDTTPSANNIRSNSIFGNSNLGIDLGNDGITANDALDADTGANTLLNYPVITAAKAGATTTVSGTYSGAIDLALTLEFFANPAGSTSREGKRFIGMTNIMTDDAGNATFTNIALAATTFGEVITATATDNLGNTSEFAAGIGAQPPPSVNSITINKSATQRSVVTTIEVSFSEAVNFPSGLEAAFTLERLTLGSGTVGMTFDPPTGPASSVTITFNADGTAMIDPGNSLADGKYLLTIHAGKVAGAGGTLDGDNDGIAEGSTADDKLASLHRLFGDSDGNGTVNAADLFALRLAFGAASTVFDYDGNDQCSALELFQFRLRFGSSV